MSLKSTSFLYFSGHYPSPEHICILFELYNSVELFQAFLHTAAAVLCLECPFALRERPLLFRVVKEREVGHKLEEEVKMCSFKFKCDGRLYGLQEAMKGQRSKSRRRDRRSWGQGHSLRS